MLKKIHLVMPYMLLSLFIVNENDLFACKNRGTQLKYEYAFNVIKNEEKSEVEKFASWFHQDWQLISPNFNEGAAQYVASLTPERKAILSKELEVFVNNNKKLSKKGFMKKWYNLGAEGWDSDMPIYETLRDFSRSLKYKNTRWK